MSHEKEISKAEAEAIAQKATQSKLRHYEWISPEQEKDLAPGSGMRDGNYYFVLYVANECPLEALVVSRTTVDSSTGAVNVEVLLPAKGG